jgi:hypothetical protein
MSSRARRQDRGTDLGSRISSKVLIDGTMPIARQSSCCRAPRISTKVRAYGFYLFLCMIMNWALGKAGPTISAENVTTGSHSSFSTTSKLW